jgi:RimJ/RimL family protein N-acetyltransferase
LIKRDFLSDVDIGYAFLPQFWSRGFALEAASAVMNYAQDVLQLKRILAVVSPDNDRSIRVLGKLGLTLESSLRMPEDGSEVMLFASRIVE